MVNILLLHLGFEFAVALSVLLTLTACREKKLAIDSHVSTNGLPYTLVSMPGNSRVSVQIAWPNHWTGSGSENQLAPYIGAELILAGGAEGYGPGQVIEEFADMTSEGFLGATPEYVFGALHYSPEHAEKTLKIANAHLRAPELDERWFTRIQDQLVSRAAEASALPGMAGFEALRIKVLEDQSLRMALNSQNSTVYAQVTTDDVSNWVESVLVRKGVSIVVAGDLDKDAASTAVDMLFAGLPEGREADLPVFTTNYEPKRVLYHAPGTSTSVLTFVGPMPPTKQGGEFEDGILIDELRGVNGVLFKEVRDKLRASYNYTAGIDAFSRANRFLLLTGEIETDKISDAEKIVRQAYAKFITTDTNKSPEAHKSEYAENLKIMASDTGSVAFSTLMALLDGFEGSKVLGLLSELDDVSVESINHRRSTAYPKESELIMIVSSPDSSAILDACVIASPEEVSVC